MFGSEAVQTHRLFHNKAKATDLDNLSTIGLLAEIVQKRASYRLDIQMVCLLRLCIVTSQPKIKAQLSGNIPSAVPCSQLNIICEFTISVARLRILFIFRTHNIGLSDFNFSVTFSFSARSFTNREKRF